MKLVHIPVEHVMPQDLLEVERAMRHSHGGSTGEDLLEHLAKNLSQLWLVQGLKTRVLLVTQILNHRSGLEMKLQYIAGHGWFRHFEEILPLVEQLARHAGCRYFGGQVRGKFAYKFYEKLGGKVAGVYCYKDLTNGRRDEYDTAVEGLEADSPWAGEYSGRSH